MTGLIPQRLLKVLIRWSRNVHNYLKGLSPFFFNKSMIKLISFFLFTLLGYSQCIKKVDYLQYHKDINRAEVLFFKEQSVDSTLFYYEKVFNSYDFIFLKDLINCAQIAKHCNKPYLKYIYRAFEFGLKVEHLNSYPVLRDLFVLKKQNDLKVEYEKGRQLYLKKIDFNYLDYIYELAVKDQVDKYLEKSVYHFKLKNNLHKLKEIINKKGFPGERLLGIADSTICEEANIKIKDLRIRIVTNPKAATFNEIIESKFAQIIPFPFFMHIDYYFFKAFDSKVLIREIKKGNIHPRDIAFFNDFAVTTLQRGNSSFSKEHKTVGFYFSTFGSTNEVFNVALANKLREELFMVPYEIDILKKEFEKKYGFRFFSGHSNYR